ncbi:pinin/SDK/memA domain protein [Beauveria brongniartii RCEF 3172]|uniref:Pinin/SDK/memA domain protein n=1 Tax=Beauveria brongniartii RCEF 3172 TaxID=1081107 RepID=A0A162M3G5_9HYPO|nr:pinin/SDK/memA domain protein [Beauveria brongniartii RCEF 3172]
MRSDSEHKMEIASPHDSQPSKRKASPERDDRGESPKRTRYDSDEETRDRSRRRSRSLRRDRTVVDEHPPERRPAVATQEDKRRGKRLFGGLMNTLNQGPSTIQQKRRQEIEKRQKERMQKQDAEDGQRRAERLAQLRAVRIREQIVFDEEVYYLPWRCTDHEQDIIDGQRRKARELVQREESEFEKRRKWHIDRHGAAVKPRPQSPPREQPRPPTASSPPDTAAAKSPMKVDGDTGGGQEEDSRADGHDDVGDIVEHAGEDMVIY